MCTGLLTIPTETHYRASKIARDIGIRTGPLFWNLVQEYRLRAAHPPGSIGIDAYTVRIGELETVHLERELLGEPFQTRTVRRSTADRRKAEAKSQRLSERLLELFPLPRVETRPLR